MIVNCDFGAVLTRKLLRVLLYNHGLLIGSWSWEETIYLEVDSSNPETDGYFVLFVPKDEK